MVKPILQVRIITTPQHAQTLIAELVDRARQLLGPGVVYRTQTHTKAERAGYVRAYITATRKEEHPVG